MNYPQQQFPQQPYPQQPPYQQQAPNQFAPPNQNLGQAAASNMFNQFLSEPPRQRANRAKPADGLYVVRFTPGCKIQISQKDSRPFLLLEYQVIESSVPQMGGQVFGNPVFWSNRPQLQDLADLAKYTFGSDLGQVQAQAQGQPQVIAQFICQKIASGLFAGVRISRTQKQVQQVGYEQAFANHGWIAISSQPMTLAQLGPALGPPAAPSMPMQQPAWQPPQAQQPAWQPPQQQQQPQQPAWQPPQQSLPQNPPLPQQQAFPQAAPPQLPQQPPPAFFVPNGGQPPR